MKVLIGGFVAESNARVKKPCALQDFMMKTGDDVVDALYVRDLFEEAGIEVLPTIYADGRAGGRVTREAFDFILEQFLSGVREHIDEIDGMFFFLHGASNVLGLEGGSGEHTIIREIRKLVGPYLPIAMVMDPHGNLSQEQADNCQIIRTFRHSPHTDRPDCHRLVAKLFIDLLNNRRDIHPVYRKVPILVGGERSVSLDEPMVSINKLLDEIEADPRILCCSYHIGYVRHDNAKCGASVIVVPQTENDRAYAEEKADQIAAFAWSKRREFHFTGNALEPEDAFQQAVDYPQSPVVITDSGDNCTAGGPGCNTTILKQCLAAKDLHGKRIVFACIADAETALALKDKQPGTHVSVELGANLDELSAKVHLEGTVKATGELHHHYGETLSVGTCTTITLDGTTIDVIIAEKAVSFAEDQQYTAAGLNLFDYDLIIVKQGYIYPRLKELAKFSVMSLTDGATNQRTEKIQYRTILRPMYPIDEI